MRKECFMPKTDFVIEQGRQDVAAITILDAPREKVFRAEI